VFGEGTPAFRTDLYASCAAVVSHRESIRLIDSLGRDFAPELKSYSPPLPPAAPPGGTPAAAGRPLTLDEARAKMLHEYAEMGIEPARVIAQSFHLEDVLYWRTNFPHFPTAFLDDGSALAPSATGSHELARQFAALKAQGIHTLASPIWKLLDRPAAIAGAPSPAPAPAFVASAYAREARAAGLRLLAWTLERPGPIISSSTTATSSSSSSSSSPVPSADVPAAVARNEAYNLSSVTREGDVMEVLHALATQVRACHVTGQRIEYNTHTHTLSLSLSTHTHTRIQCSKHYIHGFNAMHTPHTDLMHRLKWSGYVGLNVLCRWRWRGSSATGPRPLRFTPTAAAGSGGYRGSPTKTPTASCPRQMVRGMVRGLTGPVRIHLARISPGLGAVEMGEQHS